MVKITLSNQYLLHLETADGIPVRVSNRGTAFIGYDDEYEVTIHEWQQIASVIENWARDVAKIG